MSTLTDLQTIVFKALGRSDTDTTTLTTAALNYAAVLAALTFEPPELTGNTTVQVTGASNYVSISSVTNLLDLRSVYNSTDSKNMWFIPWDLWYAFFPTTVGSTKYYSLFGQLIYVRDTPVVNKDLLIHYTKYPTTMVSASDELGFDHHDSYIVSVATGIVWAFYEESESAGTMGKMAEFVSQPLSLGARARGILAGEKASLESVFNQVKSK